MELSYCAEKITCYCTDCTFEDLVLVEKLVNGKLSFVKGKWFIRDGLKVQEVQESDLEKLPSCPACGKASLRKRIVGIPKTVVSSKDTSSYKAVERLQRGLYHDSKKSLKVSKETNKEMKQQLFDNVRKGGATEIIDSKERKILK